MTANISHVDLFRECVDALHGSDADRREQHIRYLHSAIDDPGLSVDMRHAFTRLLGFFSLYNGATSDPLAMWENPERDALLSELEGLIQTLEVSPYVFHGTIFGKLKGIADEGLRPGRPSAWRSLTYLKKGISENVFFATTWRGALFWADVSAARSRGPSRGRSRQQIVIRLPRRGLALEKDVSALRPDCLMVRGPVNVADATVFIGPLVGFPIWVPLAEAFVVTKRGQSKAKSG